MKTDLLEETLALLVGGKLLLGAVCFGDGFELLGEHPVDTVHDRLDIVLLQP